MLLGLICYAYNRDSCCCTDTSCKFQTTDSNGRMPALKSLKNHSIVTSRSGTFGQRSVVGGLKTAVNNLIRIVWQNLKPSSSRIHSLVDVKFYMTFKLKNDSTTNNIIFDYFIQPLDFFLQFLICTCNLGCCKVWDLFSFGFRACPVTPTQLFHGLPFYILLYYVICLLCWMTVKRNHYVAVVPKA